MFIYKVYKVYTVQILIENHSITQMEVKIAFCSDLVLQHIVYSQKNTLFKEIFGVENTITSSSVATDLWYTFYELYGNKIFRISHRAKFLARPIFFIQNIWKFASVILRFSICKQHMYALSIKNNFIRGIYSYTCFLEQHLINGASKAEKLEHFRRTWSYK